jgi:hypothetical protein
VTSQCYYAISHPYNNNLTTNNIRRKSKLLQEELNTLYLIHIMTTPIILFAYESCSVLYKSGYVRLSVVYGKSSRTYAKSYHLLTRRYVKVQ